MLDRRGTIVGNRATRLMSLTSQYPRRWWDVFSIGIEDLRKFFVETALLPARIAAAAVAGYSKVLAALTPQLAGAAEAKLVEAVGRQVCRVEHRGRSITFATPSRICHYRAREFSSKEPETLLWLEAHAAAGPLFDIGANVGAYSIYFAALGGTVVAFEPSVFNLAVLVRNINLNGFADRINVVATPLSDESGIAAFKLASTEEGGALAAFGVDYGYDGKPIKTLVEYRTIGSSLDRLLAQNASIGKPGIVKIDVDGIENLILRGAKEALAADTCRSVLVELNEALESESGEAVAVLRACGFELKSKHQPPHFAGMTANARLFNQIWSKPA